MSASLPTTLRAGPSPRPPGPALSRQGGSVLIVTMWVCLGLLSVALVFGQTAYMSYRASANELAGRQAEQAIEGACRYAETVLSGLTTPGTFPAVTDYRNEAVSIGSAVYWMLGRGEEAQRGLTRTYGLVDEASKLNLNTATAEMLELLPNMTPDLAAAIVAWRDPANASSGLTGTGIKGGPFESEAELAMIPGMTPELLAGEDANGNNLLDDEENDGAQNLPVDNADGKLDPGFLAYVTVFSKEPATRADGSARFVVAPRVAPQTLTDLQTAFPTVTLGNTTSVLVTCASPLDFFVQTGMTAADFDLIAGDLAGTHPEGMVNVNTASETVLRCLPGMDETKAAALVTARLGRTPGDGALAWVKDVLDEETLRQAGPWLTGRTWQYTADIAAVGRDGRGYRRSRFVLDTTTGTPRVLYRRDLSGQGWALGREARQALATLSPP